jgi:hypothetical protein
MKKLLLVLSIAVGVVSSRADTYNIGDLNSIYVGFYANSDVSSQSVIINLGRSTDVFAGISLDQSALSSVLASTFGTTTTAGVSVVSPWYNNPLVYMGAFGYNGLKAETGNLFVSRDSESSLLVNSFDSTTLSMNNRRSFKDGIGAVLASHTSGAANLSYVTGSTGHQHQISVMDNSPTSFNGKADSGWSIFSRPVYTQVTSDLSVQEFALNGAGYDTVTSGASTTVRIQTTDGSVSVSVVPEPSTYALMGIAMLFLVVAYRRRTA